MMAKDLIHILKFKQIFKRKDNILSNTTYSHFLEGVASHFLAINSNSFKSKFVGCLRNINIFEPLSNMTQKMCQVQRVTCEKHGCKDLAHKYHPLSLNPTL